MAEPLTEREQEVLRHVSALLSTAEIASEMYISINTVKTHLKSASPQASATHRGDAVRRARQLQLICREPDDPGRGRHRGSAQRGVAADQ